MKYRLLLGLALIALSAPAQDTDGWKTVLATKKELKDFPKEQGELVDGLLHVRNGQGILIPQPAPDGAMRARFHFRENTGFPQLRIRRSGTAESKTTDYYELIFMIKTGQASVTEGSVIAVTRGKGKAIGTFTLPEPFVLGAYLDVEFSIIGDHLQVLINGKPAFDHHDSTIANGGYWGPAALEAWYSNIQVRTFPRGTVSGQPAPAATPAATTTAAAKDTSAKSNDLRLIQLEEAYAAAVEREVTLPHLEAVKSLDAKYAAALDRALEGTTQAGNLDAALALRAEKKRVQDAAPLPADDKDVSEPLNTLRMTYRNTLSQLTTQRDQGQQPLREKYLQALDAYQAELTRAKNLDAALEVRKFREAEAASAKAP
jgi:hypothetical protein